MSQVHNTNPRRIGKKNKKVKNNDSGSSRLSPGAEADLLLVQRPDIRLLSQSEANIVRVCFGDAPAIGRGVRTPCNSHEGVIFMLIQAKLFERSSNGTFERLFMDSVQSQAKYKKWLAGPVVRLPLGTNERESSISTRRRRGMDLSSSNVTCCCWGLCWVCTREHLRAQTSSSAA